MRAWFFDLDGTLYIDGGISDACRGALEALRAAGDAVILNTGRSPGFLPEGVRDDPVFDGMICGSVYVTLKGEELLNKSLSLKILENVAAWAKRTGKTAVFEGLYENISLNGALPDASEIFTRPTLPPITKITMWCDPENVPQKDFPGLRILHFPTYAEGILAGYDKSTGMQMILDKLGLQRSNAVAIGDSENDRDMLLYAGKAVCMRPAPRDFDGFCVYRCKEKDGVPEGIGVLFPRLCGD